MTNKYTIEELKEKVIKILNEAYEEGFSEGHGCGQHGSVCFEFKDWLKENTKEIEELFNIKLK